MRNSSSAVIARVSCAMTLLSPLALYNVGANHMPRRKWRKLRDGDRDRYKFFDRVEQRSDRERVAVANTSYCLLAAQRDNRIHAARAAGRHVAGDGRNRHERS